MDIAKAGQLLKWVEEHGEKLEGCSGKDNARVAAESLGFKVSVNAMGQAMRVEGLETTKSGSAAKHLAKVEAERDLFHSILLEGDSGYSAESLAQHVKNAAGG